MYNELANSIYGGAGIDHLIGGGGADALYGNAGADLMEGGTGNEVYYVDNALDQVAEATGGGYDSVFASVSYALAAGQDVEVLRAYAGNTGLTLTGNELGNAIIGGTGVDHLLGNGGDGPAIGAFIEDTFDVGVVLARWPAPAGVPPDVAPDRAIRLGDRPFVDTGQVKGHALGDLDRMLQPVLSRHGPALFHPVERGFGRMSQQDQSEALRLRQPYRSRERGIRPGPKPVVVNLVYGLAGMTDDRRGGFLKLALYKAFHDFA